MGRVKTKLIKRTTKKFISEHQGRFKNNFNENKKIVDKIARTTSKKLRNVVAGYLTRLTKRQKE